MFYPGDGHPTGAHQGGASGGRLPGRVGSTTPVLVPTALPGLSADKAETRDQRRRVRWELSVLTQFWEWVVLRESRNRPVGLSKTEHGAMEALAKALLTAGQPARGHVAQVTLVRPVQADSTYIREPAKRTAEFDGKVLRWTRAGTR